MDQLGHKLQFDVSSFTSGLFVVHMETDAGTVIQKVHKF